MEKLTKKEEQAMQVLWTVKKGFVKDLLENYPDPKPHYNTVSSLIRLLEEKGYVGHRAYGNTHQYYPLVTREEYRKTFISDVVDSYFGNSYMNVVSFFAREQNISADELREIIKMIEKGPK
ncbi:MAG: BlaI/MecI/CopY family transcriptional regulator [Bacteroidota bacterium]